MVKEMNRARCQVYTDGACKGNPGIGGWGAVILENQKKEAKNEDYDPT